LLGLRLRLPLLWRLVGELILVLAEVFSERVLEVIMADHGSKAVALSLLLQICAKAVQIEIALPSFRAVLYLLPVRLLAKLPQVKVWGHSNVPNFVAFQRLIAFASRLVIVLRRIDLCNEIFLGRCRARNRQIVRCKKVNVQRVVEKTVIETLRQYALLWIAIIAKYLRVKLEVVLREPLSKIVYACIGKMAKV